MDYMERWRYECNPLDAITRSPKGASMNIQIAEKLKLPKQFNHWCKRHGIYPTTRGSKYKTWIGQRRHWRINCYGAFQMSETFRAFDRWANSLVSSVPCPKTQKEFDVAIKELKAGVRYEQTN